MSVEYEKRQPKGRFGWVRRLMNNRHPYEGRPRSHSSPHTERSVEFDEVHRYTELLSDMDLDHSAVGSDLTDNVSTIPLKSIVLVPSTKAPSVLSNEQAQDNSLYVASTAETSLAPSIHPLTYNYSLHPGSASLQSQGPNFDRESANRDLESIVTLASSSRRARRRSLDTNCSTTGIPPASIMERIVPRHDDE